MIHKIPVALISFLLVISCSEVEMGHEKRSKTLLNKNWGYTEVPYDEPSKIPDDTEWETVDLPHTWNDEDTVDNLPGYRRSASWYRKDVPIDGIHTNQRYILYFEGANITTTVYINGMNAGEHIGGYLGFEVDMTPFVKKGTNEVMVRVDNGYYKDIIPSQKSDFFIYGGITRDVWLLQKPKLALGKVKVTTPTVSHSNASLKIDVPIEGTRGNTDLFLKTILRDPEGKEVVSRIQKVVNDNDSMVIPQVRNPKLWDIDSPHLYEVAIQLWENETLIDEVNERVGFRWFEFKENGPFYLNGKRVLLRGTHRHEEHAGVGAAMSNQQHRKDMELIKEMGANFVRLAHYPQDPEVYRACDELGLLVWDELPWCRGGLGGEVWQKNTKNMLKEMIGQNGNHPSVIIWSLGNEMYWLPDFEGGDDTAKMNIFLKELNTIAHTMDPTRKTAIRKYYEGAQLVDVFSPSIWSGWYSGSYKSYRKALDTYKPQYKHFLHAEYGGSSHVGRHSENPITGEGMISSDGWEEAIVQTNVANIAQIGDWSENYIVDLFDWHLRITETDSTFVGNAQWAFKDFGTPLRPENDIPYINQKGLVDRNGNPKDAFYVFKSYWAKAPFVHIESHTWTERQGPEGLARNISVFGNCNEVTLTHNGKSLGTKKRNMALFPASGLNWDVTFVSGDNILVAEGKDRNGNSVKDVLEITYRHIKNGPAKKLILSSKRLPNGNFLLTATAVDDKGLRCLDYEEKVYFQCLEGGTTLKNQGTPTGSEIIAMSNGKASIEVVPDQTTKNLKFMVLNQNFKGTYLTVEK
ncbi:glycoside hydrolase family 2 protein [Flagellimonas flava]|uniref:Beta-galactosidase n=1 Tax=Flagellimonas flava TaxID=570519 RepID=A0A1M5NNH3_9FLAO|nr:glycoside hydrolase family 2 TIM barrel-domain containing protein [Allomuricauda flava]SHG90739.1 beta-galactosidase [Allomuricauda flava]